MSRNAVCLFVVLACSLSFSQTVYQQCVQECVDAGGDLATCGSESCNPADTQSTVTSGQGNPLYLPSYELKGTAPDMDGSLISSDGNPSSSEKYV